MAGSTRPLTVGLSSGWAIGTTGWRRAIAKEYHYLSLDPGLADDELRELQEAASLRSYLCRSRIAKIQQTAA